MTPERKPDAMPRPSGITTRRGDTGMDELLVTASPVDLLHRGYRTAGLGSVVASVLAAVAVWNDVDRSTLLVWVAAVWAVLALRGWAVWSYFRAVPNLAREGRHGNRFAIGSAVSGALWGATAFLFISSPDQPALLFLCAIVGGVTAAAFALQATVPRASAAFLATALLPYCIRLLQFGDRFSVLLAAAIGLYLIVMLVASRYIHRFIIGARAAREQREDIRLCVFEQLLGESPLRELLELVVEYVETTAPSLRCSVLLLDTDGHHLHIGAAPSLPPAYHAAIDGLEMGDRLACLGTAARCGEMVMIADMLADPEWVAFRPLARADGLRSCWSVPICDATGKMRGSFICYGDTPGLPDRAHRVLIREASQLAAVAIEHRHAAELLQAREREYRTLVEQSPDAISRYDAACRLIYANPQAAHTAGIAQAGLLGFTPTEFPGDEAARRYHAALLRVLASGRTEELELEWIDAVGAARHTHVRMEPEHDCHGRPFRVLAVGRDMTRVVGYRQKLHDLAYSDALTGLPNRALLKSHVEEAFAQARKGPAATLIMLGLDRFKAVNDTFGRHCGDALLRATGERLNRSLGDSCILARLEGDEFAVLVRASDPHADSDAGPRILETLAAPFQVGSMEIRLTASLGIASAPEHGVDAEELLRCAAMALHHAKLEGRNQARRYTPDLTHAALQRLGLEADLRKALSEDAFTLHYQPKVDLATGTVVGAEALLRWRHPKRGMLAPGSFMRLAEESGLISEIGGWVLRTACRAARRWNEYSAHPCPIAVNLSARQFVGGRLADEVRTVLAETGCRPEWIELEITESLLLDDHPEIHATLDTLDQLGISLAIDDFGTGYSALSYLTRFPIRTLKIDRSFISGVVTRAESAALVKAIASMAQSLRMTVVAEGVEEPEQADFLRDIGCRLVQGYLFGRPMPHADFDDLLHAPASDLCLFEGEAG